MSCLKCQDEVSSPIEKYVLVLGVTELQRDNPQDSSIPGLHENKHVNTWIRWFRMPYNLILVAMENICDFIDISIIKF